MKKLFVILLLIISSCGPPKALMPDLSGTYIGKSKGLMSGVSQYILILNSDRTFIYEERLFEANPKCSGKWRTKDFPFVILECDEEESIANILSNGYMNKRQFKIEILSRNLILYGEILIRKN